MQIEWAIFFIAVLQNTFFLARMKAGSHIGANLIFLQ